MPYFVQTVVLGSHEHNESLRREMTAMLSHSYVNPDKVIDKRFYYLEKIFLLRKDRELHGFCSYFSYNLEVCHKRIPTVFLGIMAASKEIQNSGLVLKTMEAMVKDLQDTNPDPGNPRIVWATTASPSSLAIFRRYFINVSPDENNALRPEHGDYEKAMKKFLLMGRPDPGYPPLTVREVTPLSVYSLKENLRIMKIQSVKNDNLFQRMGIDETKGDRLIMIGEL